MSRPAIPADVRLQVLFESGHRCAVCGEPASLEFAHIVPWRQCKQHVAENILCLCAGCHARADREKWGRKTLRKYKRNPWVRVRYSEAGLVDSASLEENPEKAKIEIELRVKKSDADLLGYALAGFLKTQFRNVKISFLDQKNEPI